MSRSNLLVAGFAALALAGCHQKPKPPTGQVAAVVDGHEITVRQLNDELGSSVPSDPTLLKAAQSRALQTIILRTLLADKAKTDGLEKSPEYALQEQRLKEGLLASLYQKNLAAAVPQTSDEEAQTYIIDHPDIFAQRKIFTVDQVLIPSALPLAVSKGLAPLKTPEEVTALLSSQNIAFRRQTVEIDAVGVDPRLVARLAKLSPTDMLIIPQGGVMVLNAVKSERAQPFLGEAATAYAKNLMHASSVHEAEARQLQGLMRSAAPTIAFNPAYKPAPGASPAAQAPASPT